MTLLDDPKPPKLSQKDTILKAQNVADEQEYGKPWFVGWCALAVSVVLVIRLAVLNEVASPFGVLSVNAIVFSNVLAAFGLFLAFRDRDAFSLKSLASVAGFSLVCIGWFSQRFVSPQLSTDSGFVADSKAATQAAQLLSATIGGSIAVLLAAIVMGSLARRKHNRSLLFLLLCCLVLLISNTVTIAYQWPAVVLICAAYCAMLFAWLHAPRREKRYVPNGAPHVMIIVLAALVASIGVAGLLVSVSARSWIGIAFSFSGLVVGLLSLWSWRFQAMSSSDGGWEAWDNVMQAKRSSGPSKQPSKPQLDPTSKPELPLADFEQSIQATIDSDSRSDSLLANSEPAQSGDLSSTVEPIGTRVDSPVAFEAAYPPDPLLAQIPSLFEVKDADEPSQQATNAVAAPVDVAEVAASATGDGLATARETGVEQTPLFETPISEVPLYEAARQDDIAHDEWVPDDSSPAIDFQPLPLQEVVYSAPTNLASNSFVAEWMRQLHSNESFFVIELCDPERFAQQSQAVQESIQQAGLNSIALLEPKPALVCVENGPLLVAATYNLSDQDASKMAKSIRTLLKGSIATPEGRFALGGFVVMVKTAPDTSYEALLQATTPVLAQQRAQGKKLP